MATTPPPVWSGADVDPATILATIARLEDRMNQLEATVAKALPVEGETLPSVLGDLADNKEGLARLGAYVEARIDQRLAKAARGDTTPGAVSPSAAATADKALAVADASAGPSKDLPLKSHHLDGGVGNAIAGSVWDMCLFIGHECMGFGCSLALVLGYVLNLFVQCWFCFIVYSALTDQNLSNDKMNGLLRFRLGISHNIQYADSVTSRSMASQICNTEFKLHYAGAQLNFHDDLESFNQVQNGIHLGKALGIVAQFVWVGTIFNEVTANYKFVRAILSVPSASNTEIVVADFKDNHHGHLDQDAGASVTDLGLIKSDVDVRLYAIGPIRRLSALLLIGLPRLLLACSVGWAGINYLGETHELGDLILNAIALAFIIDCDELIYKIFMPLRVSTLCNNLEAIPVFTSQRCRWLSNLMPLLRALSFTLVMLGIYFFVLTPYWWRLAQAQDILCSGDKEFVYGINRATGMIHIAKSRTQAESAEDWEYVERVVFQAIGSDMKLESKFGWDVPKTLTDLKGSQVEAIIEPNRAADLSGTTFSNESFRRILSVQAWSIEDAAGALPCADLAAGTTKEATLRVLRSAMGNRSINSCNDVPWQMCSMMNMSQLRALCPQRCQCHQPAHLGSIAGFFGNPKYGCPSQCTSLLGSYNEAKLQIDKQIAYYDEYYDEGAFNFAVPSCLDSRKDEFLFEGECGNLDHWSDGDTYGEFCDDEAYNGWSLDNGTEINRACNGTFDDTDFTASIMCCGCGGGTRVVTNSFECATQMTDACFSMNPKARFWAFYVNGLFEYLFARAGFRDMVANNIDATILGENLLRVDVEHRTDLVDWIANGNMRKSLLNSSWDFSEDVYHPRELEGCAFLTSWEFSLLLNIDLCSSEHFVSIRFLCPVSCGCGPGNTASECPAECAESSDSQLTQQRCQDEYLVTAIPPNSCPISPAELPNCEGADPGQLCEGDGECGTDVNLNNCWPNFDVYWKFSPWAYDNEEVWHVFPEEIRQSTAQANSEVGQAPTTTLSVPVQAGDRILNVFLQIGFYAGGQLVISDEAEGISETHTIASVGSLVLMEPLANSFPAGATVTGILQSDEGEEGEEEEEEEEAGGEETEDPTPAPPTSSERRLTSPTSSRGQEQVGNVI